MNNPILITGAARSGTSMVAGIIDMCGAFSGITSGPNRYNQKGMFENAAVRNKVVKPYLESIGMCRKGQYPIPNPHKCPDIPDLQDRVERIMVEQGYAGGPWMYKGAKMTLIWPTWNKAFPDAKWVIVRRRSEDIVSSCLRTGFMNAFRNSAVQRSVGVTDEASGWEWWVRQHEERFREMIAAGLQVKMVWPETMVYDQDYTKMKEIIKWLGLEWNKREVEKFIEPKLYHTKKKRGIA
jgi:hypothetical protein